MNNSYWVKWRIYSLKKFYFSYSILFFLPRILFGQPTSQTFNASGTYIVPSGYSANVTIQAWGAGGGGGSNTSGAKGGGGGGAYASLTTTLSAGSYAVTVGLGGGAGANGGNSSFTTIVVAQGGFSTSGTAGGSGGTVAGSVGTVRIAGANGSNASGNDGGAGGAGANGGGIGGAGGLANNGSGSAGTAPGGGGGGKAGPGNAGNSGNGADGRVIVTVNSVLPVRFESITAIEKQNGIYINWISHNEENLEKYQIERSLDGVNFSIIGTLFSKNSKSGAKYSYFDYQPLPGINFYRIRSIDWDGKQQLSMIIRISKNGNVKDVIVYPNPVQGGSLSWQCHLEKGNYEIKLINNLGQEIFKHQLNHAGGIIYQVLPLLSVVTPGNYLLRIAGAGIVLTKKIIVL